MAAIISVQIGTNAARPSPIVPAIPAIPRASATVGSPGASCQDQQERDLTGRQAGP